MPWDRMALLEKDRITLKIVSPFSKSSCSLGSAQGESFIFVDTLF